MTPMSTQAENCHVFLSYNKANVTVARSVGAHLSLAGVEVWFDEWKISAGDSIPVVSTRDFKDSTRPTRPHAAVGAGPRRSTWSEAGLVGGARIEC